MSSIKLAAMVCISTALGCFYVPVAAFIARTISHLAQIVAGG
jgi:hypothetical protein